MSIKRGFRHVILGLFFALAFTGCFFYAGMKTVSAVEITVSPAAPADNTAKQILDNAIQATKESTGNTQAAPAVTPLIPVTSYLATESSHSLAIVLPEKLDVGNADYNLQSVTGYRVYVYKDSTEIYNSGNTYNEAGTGIVDLESLVRTLSLQLSNVSENLRFKVIYIGKNALGEFAEAKDVNGNTLEWMSDILSVYRVSIGGENINPAFTYGFSGQTIVLIPSMTEKYAFKQWSDGSLQNPRIVAVSTNNSENEYTAVAALPDVIVSPNEDGGYDVIPQTGENNSMFWLICIAVFGILGTGYVMFSMVLVPVNKRHDDF